MSESQEEEKDMDAAPEGASDEGRPDESSITDPDPDQQDPESGAAADTGAEKPSQAEG